MRGYILKSMKMRLFLVSAIALLSTVSAAGQKEAAFKAGEKLSFSMKHSYVNSDIIGVVFQTSATMVDGKQAYKVHANGTTFPGYRTFFDMNDTYETWLDLSTLRPLRYASRLKENKYRFRADYTYDWGAQVVRTRYRKLSRPEDTEKTLALRAGAGDALALLYNLRSEDIASFKPGERRTLRLVLDDTVRVLSYRYVGRENKKIGRAGRFRALKIVCSMASSSDPDGQLFEDGSDFTLWLSDDRNHIPLYIESPIKFGSIVAVLTKYEGLKYPLSSKIR